jgi:AbrB family looped-hinge helix DNA binding protein
MCELINMAKGKPKEGKHLFGTVKVGERGQIVIPKDAREQFDINPGDTLLVVGHEKRGLAIIKPERMREFARKILEDLEGIN